MSRNSYENFAQPLGTLRAQSATVSETRNGGLERTGLSKIGGEERQRRRTRTKTERETSAEINLTKSLLNYRNVLSDAVREKAPHLICNYLFDLAQTFSRFYESCRVKGDKREAERAVLVSVFAQTMQHALGLLGINVPEEM